MALISTRARSPIRRCAAMFRQLSVSRCFPTSHRLPPSPFELPEATREFGEPLFTALASTAKAQTSRTVVVCVLAPKCRSAIATGLPTIPNMALAAMCPCKDNSRTFFVGRGSTLFELLLCCNNLLFCKDHLRRESPQQSRPSLSNLYTLRLSALEYRVQSSKLLIPKRETKLHSRKRIISLCRSLASTSQLIN